MTQTVPGRDTGTNVPVKTRKKLIEVALPLEKINVASAREKSIRHGHPSTLHLWWARRPLAAARAIIFSQMVDDPSEYSDELLADLATRQKAERELAARRAAWLERRAHQAEAAAAGAVEDPDPGPEPTLEGCAADLERERLFALIEQLVLWENTTNEPLLELARSELRRSWRRTCADNGDHPRAAELFDPDHLPAFHDPFAGGGALPLEAQRLGLEAYASDLNPVAVLITKAMIEIPPKFAGKPPVNPEARSGRTLLAKQWLGAHGLAEDVRYYGEWMRDEAEKRLSHLYPRIEITAEMAHDRPDLRPLVGRTLTVTAWLWARTVATPNPAFANVHVPLASTFMLSTKPGKESYVKPVIDASGYRFTVRVGRPKDAEAAKNGTKLSRGSFRCLMSDVPIRYEYIDDEANAGRMGERLMAIVAEGERGKVYLAPTSEHERIARQAEPSWKPDLPSRGTWASNAQGRRYGFRTFGDYFTPRQLVALTTICDLVREARGRAMGDALAAGLGDDGVGLAASGTGAAAYAEAVSVYLAFALDRFADYWTSLGRWQGTNQQLSNMFGRQAIPMMWDYPEANPLSGRGGSFHNLFDWTIQSIRNLGMWGSGHSEQGDAGSQRISIQKVVSTDPPYYDNIGYADLSDFFYVWLRRALQPVFPDVFLTLAVPKAEELVAETYRHGGKPQAEAFFLEGMTQAMSRLGTQAHAAFPISIYYAFKQSEVDNAAGISSTGWETFLDAVIRAGLTLTGTWPIRTEMKQRMVGLDTNALASSIVLVCRKRIAEAPAATRREFVTSLKAELPKALADLQRGNIAPVDLQMAAIGPGMAVFTRYTTVLDAEGKRLSVGQALAAIFEALGEALAEQEGDFDADSRWALAWYEQFGFEIGNYGAAETLSKAKNTSLDGMVEAGIVASKGGDVRLLRPAELDPAWDPAADQRRPAWQAVHQLVQAADRGETALAELIAKLGPEAETARELAYRLFVLSDRKKRAEEALWYNGLVQSWPEAARLARQVGPAAPEQQQLFGAE